MNLVSTVSASPAAHQAIGASPRVHQAATQFEAMLLQEMVKPLTKGFGSDDDSGDAKEAGPLQSFAGEAMAGSLARSGALGFARQIEETLARSDAKKMSQNSSSLSALSR